MIRFTTSNEVNFVCVDYIFMEIDLESAGSQNVDVEVEEVDGSSFTTQGTEKALKRKRKLTSFVWRHFKLLPVDKDKK